MPPLPDIVNLPSTVIYPLSFSRQGILKFNGLLPSGFAQYVPGLPVRHELPTLAFTDNVVNGAFKVAGLRNVELTGPYMHNGGLATLAQIMDFYTRGANFPKANAKNLHPAIVEQTGLAGGGTVPSGHYGLPEDPDGQSGETGGSPLRSSPVKDSPLG